jgi:2-methylcitrate dehydratase PrpD
MNRSYDGNHPSRALAEFVATTPSDAIPDEVIARLRRLVLDWIGITAFAGHYAENAGPVTHAVDNLDTGGRATVVGQAHTHSPLYAAFLNGTFAHSMDFDDTNINQNGAAIHPGAPVVAAALADAERLGVDAAAFYGGLAVGYETGWVGRARPLQLRPGLHTTAITGIFGAVAAAARLRRLDADAIASAFGLALSKAAGSMQYLANGSWNKRLHPGFVAHDGLWCVELAAAGVIGAAESLEGRYGLLHSHTDAAHPGQLTAGLATDWLLLQTAVKPYPSCRWTHGAIDAALALRTDVPANQRAVRRSTAAGTDRIPHRRRTASAKIKPVNTVDAQFSVYFQVAAAWLDGHVDWSTYDRLTEPDITALAARINVEKDDHLTKTSSTVIIDVGGQTLCRTIDVPLGEPANWISDDALRDKFERHAGRIYGIRDARVIAATVLDAPLSTPIHELTALLRCPSEESLGRG